MDVFYKQNIALASDKSLSSEVVTAKTLFRLPKRSYKSLMISSIEPSSSFGSEGKLNRSIDVLISSNDVFVAVRTSDRTDMFSLKSAI